ncbi:hypothetical protein PIB30_000196 [Stylosanthes scabra]|uniref:Uncharacterized protein n=1 Tax=Stylosanthes scabra TaxID=79078 RepID=A0ABU6S1P0_9FABA|nr:hypothetical protein [Stylosanthes scabra]
METRLYKRKRMRTRKSATPTGEPVARWMVSGSPVKMAETKEPRSEERNWIMSRRMIGRSRRPRGLRSSEIASVMASPWSPRKNGTTTTMATTIARSIPWGAPLSSIIFSFSYQWQNQNPSLYVTTTELCLFSAVSLK